MQGLADSLKKDRERHARERSLAQGLAHLAWAYPEETINELWGAAVAG